MISSETTTLICHQLDRLANGLDELNKTVASQEVKIESIREKISVIDDTLTELKKKSMK